MEGAQADPEAGRRNSRPQSAIIAPSADAGRAVDQKSRVPTGYFRLLVVGIRRGQDGRVAQTDFET